MFTAALYSSIPHVLPGEEVFLNYVEKDAIISIFSVSPSLALSLSPSASLTLELLGFPGICLFVLSGRFPPVDLPPFH